MLACVFRHEVFCRSFLARHASIKALRARSRRVFEHKTKQSNFTGDGGYTYKDVYPVDLGTANPYYLVAQMLRSAHEAKKSTDQNTIKPPEEVSLHPDVIELIKAMVDNFEPAIDTVDDMAVRAVMKAFTCFQPPPETTEQLLLREIALDGGRIPSRLLTQPQPMPLRFKYALDGCKSFTEATERLRNIATRLERCQVLPSADPGAALLGDYGFVPGPPPPVRPGPTSLAASVRAGDLLPGLLWPDDPRAPPSLAALHLPPQSASKLGSVMLTQPVGRDPDLGVTHMATLRWDAAGQPRLTLHANALWRGVVLQPRRGGWPPGIVPPPPVGPPTAGGPRQPYPYPPFLSHQAIHDANSAAGAPLAAPAVGAARTAAADAAASPHGTTGEAAAGPADAHSFWRHELMFDSRARDGAAVEGGSGDGPAAATWTCRVVRSEYGQTSDVQHADRFIKPFAFRQWAKRWVKDTPVGPLALHIAKWAALASDRQAGAHAVLRRAAARWQHYRQTLAAAVASARGRKAPRSDGATCTAYQPPGPAIGADAVLSRTWVGSTHRALEKGGGAPQPEPAAPGWGTGPWWPWTPQWLPVSFTADTPEDEEGAMKAIVGAKLLDAALVTQYCDAASLAWRLDKRVAPFVRAHPFSESDTLVGDKTKLWELFAWTADCEPPRESAAAADPGQPNVSVETPQHTQHGKHAGRSWEDEMRATAPHHGVFPVVTPPDWRYQWRKKRWLLEVPVKSLWSEARTRQQHAGLALFMTNTLDKLAKEGWALDAARHGVLYLSRPQGDRLEIRRSRAVTAALAFGVLPEIRAVPRGPPGERFAQTFGRARIGTPDNPAGLPFRKDVFTPVTAVDVRALADLGLPPPAALDDTAAMRAHAAAAVAEVMRQCERKVVGHEARFEARCKALDLQEITPA